MKEPLTSAKFRKQDNRRSYTHAVKDEMKEVQELDAYVQTGSLMQSYWIAISLVLVTAGGGILAVLACWYKRCRFFCTPIGFAYMNFLRVEYMPGTIRGRVNKEKYKANIMLGLYCQSMAKVQLKKTKEYRDEHLTGHDRFFRRERTNGPKKRTVRESKSATEIAKTITECRSGGPRSSSSDKVMEICASRESITSSGSCRRASKIESFARLFSCIAVAGETAESARQNEIYAYTALEPDNNVQERLELERKAREMANSICSHYLRSNTRYTFVDQLNDIGSRLEKHWFIVRDSSVKTERLLTLLPHGPNCPIQCNAEMRAVILDLFLALQHPYIYPVLDINFRELGSKSYIFITLPLNAKGSLKDYMYKSHWQDDWGRKYSQRSAGLPISQIQRLGRQILEALLFLKKKGFPPSGHIHSGNIILQNGVARLSGLENTLFGFTSRNYPVIWPRAQSEPGAMDSLCFGHVLFEMCAGYELDSPKPTPGNLLDLHRYPQVIEVLEFIFDNPEMRLPTIEELLLCDLFRNIDLREIRNQAQSTQVFKTHITAKGLELLNELKKLQNVQMKKFKASSISVPYFETDSPLNSQLERSASSGGSDRDVDDAVADDAYDADANSDSETFPGKEHRCLSLHSNSINQIINFQPAETR